jgi:hypothetical protein
MRVKAMRNLVLAVGGVLLITAGIVLAAVMAITPHGSPGVIGPAVVVGTAGSGTPSPAGDDHVHSVSPSPAVQVTDDHGGRRSGRHGD